MVHIDFTLNYFQIYLIIINIFAFMLYGYDKALALKTHKVISRISENKLLLSSLLGGTVGSLTAMFLFRHKVKKNSFIIKFFIVLIVQIAVVFFSYKEGFLI